MSAKEVFNNAVKNALVRDDWNLVNENFNISFETGDVNDEEILMIFEKDGNKIAVIAETFLSASPMQDFHFFVGRHSSLRVLLQMKGFDYKLYSAISEVDFNNLFNKKLLETEQIPVIVYDFQKQKIISWSNRKRIMSPRLVDKSKLKDFKREIIETD